MHARTRTHTHAQKHWDLFDQKLPSKIFLISIPAVVILPPQRKEHRVLERKHMYVHTMSRVMAKVNTDSEANGQLSAEVETRERSAGGDGWRVR